MKFQSYDFRIRFDEGTLVFLRPLTKEARNWIYDHLGGSTWLGNNVIIEKRNSIKIVKMLARDGLTIAPLITDNSNS